MYGLTKVIIMGGIDLFFKGFGRSLIEISSSGPIINQLVSQQLILRYRRTVLGYLWTLINPLVMMTIMAVVFSTLFKQDLKTFTLFLFAGMIPWNFFSSVVTQSSPAFIANEGLIKKIYLPKIIFPLSITVALLIDSLLAFVALFIIMLVLGSSLTSALLFIPFAYFLLFIFSLGLGLIVSIATVFFRDLQHVILIVIQALFFMTPIFYKPESLVGKVKYLMDFNPVVPFIELFREPLLRGVLPELSTVLLAASISLISLFVGLMFYVWQERNLVFRL